MKIALAIGGSSGSIYARILLDRLLSMPGHEISWVMSANAEVNWKLENENHSLDRYPFRRYAPNDFNAPFASGSAGYDAMIICPCSAGLLGRIANGVSDDLVTRGADVMLKERKKLVLVFRETPLNLIHIENMKKVTLAGGIICPAIPSFYSHPASIDELAATVSNRALELIGLDTGSYRWGG
ncbi:MAG TPA: UbiX family flavin prenyltransferase [Saprospiraceae bacterium]|nr:UbiX family flavin prenyltransferase [Saprospiraceae bacterium]